MSIGEREPETGFQIARFDVLRDTHRVNFAEQASFTDPIVADACVVVLTSDGDQGSISHLAVDSNPLAFAEDLRDLLAKARVPVCLSGGIGTCGPSVRLANSLVDSLRRVGFVVSTSPLHSDLLGRFSRQATLLADRVQVMK